MLRVIGLTLVVVTGAAKVGHAETWYEGAAANQIETTQRHAPDSRQAALDDHDVVQLQIGGGLGFTPAGQDQERGSGQLDLARTERQERGGDGRRLARIGTAPGRSDDWLSLTQSTKPTLAYAINSSLSVGLNYHYDSGENMNFKLARVGGIDANFHSHNIMFEAYFEF